MEKFYITWEEIEELVDLLCSQIVKSGYQITDIYGLQRGGLIPAVLISHKLGIPMTKGTISPTTLIVDDICDSGETFKKIFQTYQTEYSFPFNLKFACLHFKPHTSHFNPDFSANKFFSDSWISYPWEREDSKTIQDYKL
jgi:hypoxanthine phosphoribosyltransferase